MAGKSKAKVQREAQAARPSPMVVASSLALMLLSSFAVIHSSHACRKLYAELQTLESTQWHLQEEYGRLLLEQSTWASHYRVEKVARTDLGMVAPSLDKFRVIEK